MAESRPQGNVAPIEISAALQAALSAEISCAVMAAVEDAEQRLSVANSEAADLANAGSALEAERDELLAQVKALQSERDVLHGKAAQLSNDLLEQSGQLAEAQAAAEAARVEQAKALLKVEAQGEAGEFKQTKLRACGACWSPSSRLGSKRCKLLRLLRPKLKQQNGDGMTRHSLD